MSKKLFALVKWIGGDDDKKYSPDVPVDWIKSFDIDDFQSDEFDVSLSYVIEWHTTKKEPPAGWPVYDGYIIAVSQSITVLQNKLKALDGLLSPRNAIILPNDGGNENIKKTLESFHSSISQQSRENISRDKDVRPSIRKNRISSEPIPAIFSNKKRSAWEANIDPEGTIDNNSSNDELASTTISGCTPLFKAKKLKTQLYKAASKCSEETTIAGALSAIHQELKRLRKKRSDLTDSSESSDDEGLLSTLEQQEIGRKCSNIFITNEQWRTAKMAKSYTAIGKSLLLSLFPMEVLLKSNLRGGHCKVRGVEERTAYSALDPKILDALYYTVRKCWKRTFCKAGLGSALNNKLTQLRSNHKKQVVETHSDPSSQNGGRLPTH